MRRERGKREMYRETVRGRESKTERKGRKRE